MTYSEAKKKGNRRWLEKNREKWNSINLRSYHRLKEIKQTFRELCNLTAVFQ